MSSFLTKTDGIYDPLRRFAITNTDTEIYELKWDGRIVARLNPGDTVELPHHLAVLAAVDIADRVIMREVQADEKLHPGTPSKLVSKMLVPTARKDVEDKIIKEIEVDREAPQYQILVSQKREELLADLNSENAKPLTSISVGEDALSAISPKK